MSSDFLPCHGCGKLKHIDLIDGKPQLGGDENSGFSRLECEVCYGPGWIPLRWESMKRGTLLQRIRGLAKNLFSGFTRPL